MFVLCMHVSVAKDDSETSVYKSPPLLRWDGGFRVFESPPESVKSLILHSLCDMGILKMKMAPPNTQTRYTASYE